MSEEGKKHAHQRYQWYEQIIADGLFDLVGVAHVIAQNDWIIGYDKLASSLRVDRTNAILKVHKLVNWGHLIKTKGIEKRGKGAVNTYGMVLKPKGCEITTPESGEITTPGVVKSPRGPSGEITTRFSSSSQNSSQEVSQESPLSNSRLGKKKEKPPNIKTEVVDQGSFNPHPDAQGSTTPTKAKQNGTGFDDDDEISKLLNKFAIDDPTYRQLKKLKGSEAPAILKLASKKTNPKGYILVSITNAQQEADAAGDKLGTLLDKDARDVILRRELSDIQAAQLRHLISETGDRLRRGFENACNGCRCSCFRLETKGVRYGRTAFIVRE